MSHVGGKMWGGRPGGARRGPSRTGQVIEMARKRGTKGPGTRPQSLRLSRLSQAIRAGRYPNCTSFAREGECSRRTVLRDVELLRQMGAPVAYDEVRRGYFYEEASWQMPMLELTEGELLQLLLAERMAAQYRGTPLARTLGGLWRKLAEALPGEVSVDPAWLEAGVGEQFSFHAAPARRVDEAVWTAVVRALRGCRVLRMQYRRPDWDRARPRVVEPVHVASVRGEWYVVARKRGEALLRQFTMSRIVRAEVARERFEPEEFDPEAFFAGRFDRWVDSKGRTWTVEVRFTAKAAPWVLEREWHPQQEVRRHRDGGATLVFPAPNLEEVKRWVLQWGGEAEVTAPARLRAAVISEIAIAKEKYLMKNVSRRTP